MNLGKFMFTELFIISFREHVPQHKKVAVLVTENRLGEGLSSDRSPIMPEIHGNKFYVP